MKTPRIVNAVGYIDDDLVSGANRAKVVKKNAWLKWGSIAACFVIMIMAAVIAVPMMFGGDDPIPPIGNEGADQTGTGEAIQLERYYDYQIKDGMFAPYIGGKVIAEDKLGNKISDVNLTAGWKNDKGEWVSETEALRGEVYTINGVSNDVAVALKFIDKGEAVTTTHYYVIMNPNADLTPVKDYIIAPIVPNDPGDEMVNE